MGGKKQFNPSLFWGLGGTVVRGERHGPRYNIMVELYQYTWAVGCYATGAKHLSHCPAAYQWPFNL